MQAEQQSERERFEEWCKERYLCHEHSFARTPYEYAHTVSHRTMPICYASVQMLWEAFRDARAALSHPSTGQWMQIESAPKDGYPILVWCSTNKCVEIAYWSAYSDRWVICDGDYTATPTHWMPLPPPPPQGDKT